jgi:hypothetical protein
MQIDLDLSDVFDDVCSINSNANTTGTYGHTTQVAGATLASGVSCKLLPDTRRGINPGADKEAVVSKYILYLFPVPNVVLAENLWVMMTTRNGVPLPTPQRYNIKEVVEPVVTGAPYELRMERVKS